MSFVRYLLLLSLLAHAQMSGAQVVSTLPPGTQAESFFLYEVKLVDEFIERFNDDPASYIRTQSRELLGTDSMINRQRMIRSLFDKKQRWGADADSFTRQVCHDDLYLSFADSTWYARAVCLFSIGGKTVKVPVALRIAHENGGLKWVVAGVDASALPPAQTPTTVREGNADFIPTSAHGTGFLHLQYVFAPGAAVAGHFDKGALSAGGVSRLMSLLSQRRARFIRVAGVSYHFFQLPGWVFTVEQHKRKETNSGWLITKLERATEQQKQTYVELLLKRRG